MLTGDIVRNDIIQAGYGTSSDMKHLLSVFTVDLNNPNKNQFANDLNVWFDTYEPLYVTEESQGGYGILPPLP